MRECRQRFWSLVFDLYFYGVTGLVILVGLPFLCGPRAWAYSISNLWGRLVLGGATVLLGLTHRVKGKNVIPSGPVIFASQHQSAWETVAMCHLFSGSVFILKKELMRIPLLNFYFLKQGAIPVDRSLGRKALKPLVDQAKIHQQEGRSFLIYPQGKRVAPGDKTRCLPGVFILYQELQIPVVPVALNSGLFWPRRSLWKTPGCVTVSLLSPIMPGLSRVDFMKALENALDQESDLLIQESQCHKS